MTTPIRVLGISGSLRKGSYNTAVLRACQELLPAGMTLEIFDLAEIPLYNGDVQAKGSPETVQKLRDAIAAADALLVASPEYNYSFTGVLKNAIDWASRPPASPLFGKPVAIVGATNGMWGTARGQYQLRQVFQGSGSLALTRPEILINKTAEKFDANLNLTDADTRDLLGQMLTALADWTRTLKKI